MIKGGREFVEAGETLAVDWDQAIDCDIENIGGLPQIRLRIRRFILAEFHAINAPEAARRGEIAVSQFQLVGKSSGIWPM